MVRPDIDFHKKGFEYKETEAKKLYNHKGGFIIESSEKKLSIVFHSGHCHRFCVPYTIDDLFETKHINPSVMTNIKHT